MLLCHPCSCTFLPSPPLPSPLIPSPPSFPPFLCSYFSISRLVGVASKDSWSLTSPSPIFLSPVQDQTRLRYTLFPNSPFSPSEARLVFPLPPPPPSLPPTLPFSFLSFLSVSLSLLFLRLLSTFFILFRNSSFCLFSFLPAHFLSPSFFPFSSLFPFSLPTSL